MNTQIVNQNCVASRGVVTALAGLALSAMIFTARVAPAQDFIIDSFSDASDVQLYTYPGLDWANFRTYVYNSSTLSTTPGTWDPNIQSPGNPNPGAMYVSLEWPTNGDPNWNNSWNDVQLAFSTGGTFDSSNYIAFDIDILIDVTNSFTCLDGSYGAIELIVNNPWTTVVGWATLAPTNGWQHFSGSFAAIPGGNYTDAILGFISNGSSAATNTINYWIDNVRFTAMPAVNTNQPPLSITKAPPPGLTCICSQPGGTYQRQVIETVNSDYSWNTDTAASNTTTYSMTIAAYPAASHAQFADQMFLIPQAGMIGSPQDSDIDWDSADVVDLYVNINPDQSATGVFQYKVNQSSSWNTSLVVTKNCATGPVGTWSLSFNDNTNITLTAPDGTSTNFAMNASDASLFQDPLFVYLGDQPNVNGNIGQSSTFSQFTITGAASSIDDNFATDGTLNTNLWANDTASDENGIFMTAPDAKYWITWPTPDGGFSNVYATDNLANQVVNSQWIALPSSATGWLLVNGNQRLTVINQSALNTAFGYQPTNCFFGLWHP